MPRLIALSVGLLWAGLALAQASQPSEVTSPQAPAPAAQAVQRVPPPDLSQSADLLEARGDELRAQRLYGDAIDYYRAALSKIPNRAMLWNKMGLAELRLAHYDSAKKDFQKAMKVDHQFSDAVGNLGATYYLQGAAFTLQKEHKKAEWEYGKAVKFCRKAIKMRPDMASFHNNLANAYFSRKEYDKAVAEFARALELDPDILERHSSTGVQAQIIGVEDRARYDYELSRVYARSGNLDRALLYLRKAIEDGYPDIKSVYKEDEFAQLRKDPRFTELMTSKPASLPQ